MPPYRLQTTLIRTIRRIKASEVSFNYRTLTKKRQAVRMSSSEPYIDEIKRKLSSIRARFYFKTGEIGVLGSPSNFHETLKRKILQAKERVFLASLYIGKGQDDLIECLNRALEENPKLRIYVLIDGLRGTREAPSKCSVSLVSQLLDKHQDRVDLRLYRTPACVGWKGWLLPRRINEGLGLQHMKIYGFDEEVILSGANLSSDYFTNRQDRYYVFHSRAFSDYYFDLQQLISGLSYKVKKSNNAQKFGLFWPKDNLAIEPALNKTQFVLESSAAISNFLLDKPQCPAPSNVDKEEYPTVVYSISQFTPLFPHGEDLSTEKPTILSLISSIKKPSISWTFTAGYFNVLPEIKKGLVSTPSKQATVITASPYANGFFESKGASGHLPAAYLHLSKKFLKSVKRHGKEANIILREWKNGIVNKPGGWSYHAKGLWIADSSSGDSRPMITCIGSSNYTRRAYSLDLESNAVILTRDNQLRDEMQQELNNLLQNTKKVNLEDFRNEPHRKVNSGVKLATFFLGKRL
ncbi:hypothetical protein HG536_0C02910 [Torulaspora globosa]|uniref:CDP-diacylglycerol--glycerol-3-phosphate 3-phosphatidyltransferase n=1 Tax=Torulaspora globosa TaxID=48254 RepID=A0A7G3ZF36_9SACH|nr:uncharacterized protein HG536_0C02910 [Torulaspora globosa]QLL32122.1 hypothetical protein HG536_0C02910 [Torulaspora globosa]